MSFADAPWAGCDLQLDTALAGDLFAWTYRRSIQKYVVVMESVGAPDPLRLKYRLPAVVGKTYAAWFRVETLPGSTGYLFAKPNLYTNAAVSWSSPGLVESVLD